MANIYFHRNTHANMTYEAKSLKGSNCNSSPSGSSIQTLASHESFQNSLNEKSEWKSVMGCVQLEPFRLIQPVLNFTRTAFLFFECFTCNFILDLKKLFRHNNYFVNILIIKRIFL